MDPNRPRLIELRAEIHRLGLELNRPVWVAGVTEPYPEGISRDEIQIACMRHVRAIPEFICVVDGSYGTPWNPAELCVLELEIITATLAGKPFHFFLLAPYENDFRTEGLLRVVQLLRPEIVRIAPQSPEQILATLEVRLGRIRTCVRRCLRFALARRRTKRSLDVQFLGGNFVPLSSNLPTEELIRELLAKVSSADDQPTQLVYTWMAIRRLCAVPYDNPAFGSFLPLWNTALGNWGRASAWYGLHGHHFLGRLAAVNTLVRIRERITGVSIPQNDNLSIQVGKGALASEYYSIAKATWSLSFRRQLRRRALHLVDEELACPSSDRSGLLAIRGSVLQALGQFEAGQHAYNLMLKTRLAANEDSGRIGEAEAEVGWGYFRLWLHWRFLVLSYLSKAQYHLSRGVSLLQCSAREEFLVRAMWKLGLFYVMTLRLLPARDVLERAHDLAQAKEMPRYLRQIRRVTRVLRIIPRRRHSPQDH